MSAASLQPQLQRHVQVFRRVLQTWCFHYLPELRFNPPWSLMSKLTRGTIFLCSRIFSPIWLRNEFLYESYLAHLSSFHNTQSKLSQEIVEQVTSQEKNLFEDYGRWSDMQTIWFPWALLSIDDMDNDFHLQSCPPITPMTSSPLLMSVPLGLGTLSAPLSTSSTAPASRTSYTSAAPSVHIPWTVTSCSAFRARCFIQYIMGCKLLAQCLVSHFQCFFQFLLI